MDKTQNPSAETPFICPVCRCPLLRDGGRLLCTNTETAKRHSFDISSSGCVNLTAGGAKPASGDDAAMVAARTEFLSYGHYLPLADRIHALLGALPQKALLVDAGCGEGYYTQRISEGFCSAAGIDLSKRAAAHAARAARAEGQSDRLFYAVASVFSLPVADRSADAVTSIFAPFCKSEFERILRPGGLCICAAAGKTHLSALKGLLYERVTQNEPRHDLPDDPVHFETLSYSAYLSSRELNALFAMTPYFYRTGEDAKRRLLGTEGMECDFSFDIFVYKADRH